MSRIIDDFLESARTYNGYGFFEDQGYLVIKYSEKVTRSQRRKYRKFKKPPLAFNEYLMALDTVQKGLKIPQNKESKADLINKKKTAKGFADHIREQILKDLYPDMHVMFGIGEKLGKDLYKIENKLSLERRQGYKGPKKKTK